MKLWNASATSLVDEEADAADEEPVVVDAAVAAAAVLAVVDDVAPIDASAPKTAAITPLADWAEPDPADSAVLDVL